MSQNRFWNLLAKKLSGEALPEELAELEFLMKSNPDCIPPAENIENLWKLKTKDPDAYDAELAFEQHLNQMKQQGLSFPEISTPAEFELGQDQPAKKRKLLRYSLLAIPVLMVAALSLKLFSPSGPGPVAQKRVSEVSTRKGSKTKLVLPDSTIVWLNAGSKLTYNETFGIDNRATTLTGEAFFDVKKSTIPFLIHASTVNIKVLGTAFNVKSYPNEKTTETSLIRGTVEITLDKRPGEKFILKPNEKLVVANEQEVRPAKQEHKKEPMVVLSELTHALDNSIIETSWVNNKLLFQDESFEDVVKKMERWFNVTIEISDERIAGMRLTGTFENETIWEALEALQITAPFHYTVDKNKITITQ